MKTVRIGISGASGRMGLKLIEAIYKLEKTGAVLAAALECPGHLMLRKDAALLAGQVGTTDKSENEEPVLFSSDFDESVHVYVDFSTPAAAIALSKKCRKHKIPMVVGVTGFSEAEEEELKEASADIPLLISPNMSSGMLVMFDIMRQVTSLFKNYYDIDIFEAHHRNKKDAPSGTALRLGEIIAEELDLTFDIAAVFNRPRKGNARGENKIAFSHIRAGDTIGEHHVIFSGLGEQIEIIHRTTDRINYAVGAITAAMFLIAKKNNPKVYSMEDIIELPTKKTE